MDLKNAFPTPGGTFWGRGVAYTWHKKMISDVHMRLPVAEIATLVDGRHIFVGSSPPFVPDLALPKLKTMCLGQFFSTITRATDSETSDHASERRYHTMIVAPRGVRGKIAC